VNQFTFERRELIYEVPAGSGVYSMTTFNTQRQMVAAFIGRGIAGILLRPDSGFAVLSVVVAGYLEWSSASIAEFKRPDRTIGSIQSFPDSSVLVHPVKGQAACYRKAH